MYAKRQKGFKININVNFRHFENMKNIENRQKSTRQGHNFNLARCSHKSRKTSMPEMKCKKIGTIGRSIFARPNSPPPCVR